MENITKTTHPLILVAAGAVTVASLAAAAHFTGLIPSRSADVAPPAAVAAAPAATPGADMPPPPPARAEAPAAAPAAPAAPAATSPRPAPRLHAQHRESRPYSDVPPPRAARNEGYEGGTRRVGNDDAGIDVIPARRTGAADMPPPPPGQSQSQAPACRECGTVESVREVETQGEGTGLGAIAGGVLGGVLGHQVGRGSGKDLATIAGAVGGAVAGHQVEKKVRSEKQYQVTIRFDDGSVRTYNQSSATGWRNGERVRLANGNIVPI